MDGRLRRPRLVGRGPELALLGERLRAVGTGIPAAVAIGGDAGSGKSRLLREFLSALPATVTGVLGCCYDGRDPPVPFAPLLDALRGLPDDGVAPLSPRVWQRPAAEVFEEVLPRLERAARRRPLVLAVDDLQLADSSTLDLLAFLVVNLRTTRTLVLLTWCSERLPGAADLRHYVAELSGDAGITRIDLRPLSREQQAELLADARGRPLGPRTERACWERAEGNPFAALELLAAADGRNELPEALPDTLADLMLARLDALGGSARRVVRIAAAAGRPVDSRLLEALGGMPAADLYAALHEVVDQQVLVPTADGRAYRFRTALLCEAASAELLPGERRHILGRYTPGPDAVPTDRAGGTNGIPWPRAPRLTPRELQVLALVASGETNRTIAHELFISEKTASVHVSNILAKLGARSRTAAAAAAHRLGVLD